MPVSAICMPRLLHLGRFFKNKKQKKRKKRKARCIYLHAWTYLARPGFCYVDMT